MEDTAPIRVLVIADDPLIRGSLVQILTDREGIAIIGSIPAAQDSEDEIDLYRPDILVWDLGWDPIKAMGYLKEIQEIAEPVLALVPESIVLTSINIPRLGGLLFRNSKAELLISALKTIYQGLLVFSPAVLVTWTVSDTKERNLPIEALTNRENEVLRLLAEGKPNKVIARELGISDHTVKFHVNSIMEKLGAQSRTDAVVRATRRGIISL